MKKEFARLFYLAFYRALKNVQSAVASKQLILNYNSFPKTDLLKNDLPYFTSHIMTNEAPLDYSYLFRSDSKYSIKLCEEWDNLFQYVKEDSVLSKYFGISNSGSTNIDFIEIHLHVSLTHFTEYYIHTVKSFRVMKTTFLKLFKPFVDSIYLKTLYLSICFPIPLIKFSFNKRKISENIFIEKISDENQLARNETYASNSNHNLISGAASHYLVLKNWRIDNPKNVWDIESILINEGSFEQPLEIARNFIASLRLETNLTTGITQVLSIPNNWTTGWKAHLNKIFRFNVREYNFDLEKGGWQLDQESISDKKIKGIIRTFNNISKISNNSFKLALNRYNEYYIRKNERDKIIDLTTALESLITSDSRTEITYRLSNRIAILFQKNKVKLYSSSEIFDIVKKIYEFRGAVVHGDTKIDKKRKINLANEKSIDAIDLAHEILKEILRVLIKNEHIYKPIEIDKLLLSC